jgi:hypothetical protein
MNAKQSLREASKRIIELEHYNKLAAADIKLYNAVIIGMIEGESPCKWCEDHKDCQLKAKDGKGCREWWLTCDNVITNDEESTVPDVVEGSMGGADEG